MKNLLLISFAIIGLTISTAGIASQKAPKAVYELEKIFKELKQNVQSDKSAERQRNVQERRKITIPIAHKKNLAQNK